MITAPRTGTPEMEALLTLAERYNRQFAKLVETARENSPVKDKISDRLPPDRNQTGPVYDLQGDLIGDESGEALQRDDRVQLRDGRTATVSRIDRRRRRVLAQTEDGSWIVVVAHRVRKIKTGGRKRKTTSE